MTSTLDDTPATPTHSEGRAMASPLRLTTVGGDRDSAWALVTATFEAAEQAMSRFRPTSDLVRLDAAAGAGRTVTVDRLLVRAVVAADRAHRLTGGRFDPRVLDDLERLGDRGVPLTTDRARTDRGTSRRIVSRWERGRALALDHPIDLGGIGKGLALRWAADALRRAGVQRFLLDAGGDLVGSGQAPEGGPWQIGLEDPHGGDVPLAVVSLDGGAIATSSVRRRSWDFEGRVVHHLIDPRSGEPADGGLRAVTVAGPDPAWAEVWSKSLFVGGVGTIAQEARQRGLAAWWVCDDGSMAMTPAARARTGWVASEA